MTKKLSTGLTNGILKTDISEAVFRSRLGFKSSCVRCDNFIFNKKKQNRCFMASMIATVSVTAKFVLK